MSLVKSVKILGLLVMLLNVGCAMQTPYDYSALKQYPPRSILVLPPVNNTVEVNAPYTFLSTISKPLAEKGYYVFPVSVIDHLMKENGLHTPEDMNGVSLQKIDEIIGADAVLYVTIEEWGQKYQVITSRTVVNAKLKLVDVKTGELLWDATAYAEQSSGDGGAGIAGALVGAVIQQIAGSVVDLTPGLARNANNASINNKSRGLTSGPYAQPAVTEQ